MRIWNLTPHEVHYDDGRNQRVFPSDGRVRLEQHNVPAEPVKGLQTVQTEYGALSGFPKEIVSGDVVIVATIVGDKWSLEERPKNIIVLVPDTGPSCQRDMNGRIVSVSRFIRK